MAVDMFLEIKEIPGESQKKGHEKQIDIVSFSFGAVQTGSFAKGGAGGGAGKAEFQDISIVKEVDKSSPKLFEHCGAGTHFPKAIITVRKAGGTQMPYYKIELSDLIISSLQNSGSAGGDAVMESLTMNCAKIDFGYTEQDAKGNKVATINGGFDVRSGVVA